MQSLKLEEVIPESPEFELSNGKRYELRLLTLDDHVWLRNKFGSDEALGAILKHTRWDEISQIVFRLLTDKSDFLPMTVEEHDDDGNPITVKLTGPQRLRRSMKGVEDGLKIISALTSSIVKSSPVVEEHVREELKKKMAPLNPPAGEFSGTSSPASTDTPSISSAG